jgi:hypothetical protein
MSLTSTVYLHHSKLPDPKAWAAAIRSAGFALEMDSDFDVKTFSGFLPCTHEGEKAGFEYYYGEIDPADLSDETRANLGGRDVYVSFVSHSEIRELISAVIAASVLCDLADGVFHDDESGEDFSAQTALERARDLELEMKAELDAPPMVRPPPPLPPRLKDVPKQAGTISAYDEADRVGRIRLETGEQIKFGGSACHGLEPEKGLSVLVAGIEPHPLGGRRAVEVWPAGSA